jgi:hypothetical protein
VLPRRIWRVASAAAAAIEGAAIASNLMVRWLQPMAAQHTTDKNHLELVREIEACDVRLRLLPPADGSALDESFRRELEQRRDEAAARLGQTRTLV